ncbi:alkaline phosphatase [Halodesulfovibrio spirochaetisodalis]|uniref:Alkaline phosphatase n=1 Tax=Halodesulfovibrio spirochaetisodalis TaxID=1560234 RepID=A0A1B7XQ32_9BACT|nr:alkaline phosphatase [Halodesulfovibrio spirochaetisodalis]OBQ57622.1 alkaline phosphatase [Halodesulfovibrio spirochaetisodalis]
MRFSGLRSVSVFVCMVMLLAGSVCLSHAGEYYSGKPAKYVFLFIGDGMGIAQKMSTEAITGKKLVFEEFPVQGITTTQANNRFIVGSAAAATAMSSGQITNIGMIGMAPDGKHVKTIAEMARDKGHKVGIVSSVSIDHATPAAFYAHVPKRSQYHYIDHALAASKFDYFAGGGLKDPKGTRKGIESRGNAFKSIKKAGYKIASNRKDFEKLSKKSGKVLTYNEWLQDSGATPYEIDRRAQDISLAEFTAKGIALLDNPEGFFMMVEGGKIDWACHANDAKAAVMDTIAFNNAVKEAVAFYKKHPNDTLIVVTGDHETGGMTLGFAGTKYETHFDILAAQNASFKKFTQEVMEPFKKSASGKNTFEDLKPEITKYFGLKFEGDPKQNLLVLKPFEVAKLKEAFMQSMAGHLIKNTSPQAAILYGSYDPLVVAVTHIINNKAGLAWTSFKHTGTPVVTSAMGVGAESFKNHYHQSEIAKKIMAVMGITPAVSVASK